MAATMTKDAPTQHANGTTMKPEAIEVAIKDVQQPVAAAGSALVAWMRRMPLASLGLAAVLVDETRVVMNKLFMNTLVERGELVRKDAEHWMQDLQARFR